MNKKEQLTPLQKAFLVIEQLQSKLEALEDSRKEPIAIIGIGCRFPGGADTPEAFWNLLHQGKDAIAPVPEDRWNIDRYYDPDPETPGKIYTRYGGFVEHLQEFDAQFFAISRREALSLDPQQRLLLEVSWEALENAAINPQKLTKTKTGVFIGIASSDYYQHLFNRDKTEIDAYMGTGNAHSTAAGRISYTFGFIGPSLAVDTACSSSLVNVHLACRSLRDRESDLVLVGGVNRIFSPDISINFSRARMLAPDGHCKTFDAKADGYVRGEGCGIIVLKRLKDALADKDRILAVIKGSALNQDGHTSGLTVPNGPSQQAVIRQALANSEVEPAQVSYIEAHGTGTSLGDPIELGALGAVFGSTHTSDQPLIVGAVKTNIGHLEAAAGVAGLIKLALQLQHQQIVPHLNFQQPSPYINWEEFSLAVPTQLTAWDSQPRIGGVSSFGFSGTNAHVVLAEAPVTEPVRSTIDRPVHLFTLSAKTETALKELASRYQKHLIERPELAIADVCYTANTGRAHFHHRLAIVAASSQELIEKLDVAGSFSSQVSFTNYQPKIAFLFTGQGSQYLNMGRQLYETSPTFRKTLERCDEILKSYLERSIIEVLYVNREQENQNSTLIDDTAYTQPALFALEYALAQLWLDWGIKPDIVLGHSVGEYVAACLAGVFSLEDALKLIATRGKLMSALPSGGKMVAVMASESVVLDAIAEWNAVVSIAAVNAPEATVISGAGEAIDKIVNALEAQQIKTKLLQVSHAFHSPLMSPMLAEFEQLAKEIAYSQPHLPIISNLTGELVSNEIASASYWVNHIQQPVRFWDSINTLKQQGYEILLEIGPQPILLGMAKQRSPENAGLMLPSLRTNTDNWQQILDSLGKLYLTGIPIDWSGLDRDYQRCKIVLPTYAWQRQRYWIETKDRSQRQVESVNTIIHPLLGQKLDLVDSDRQIIFESLISRSSPAYLDHHRVFGKIVLPGVAYLEMALTAGRTIFQSDNLVIEDLNIHQALILPESGTRKIQLIVIPLPETEAFNFEISSFSTDEDIERQAATVHASGKLLKDRESNASKDIERVDLGKLQKQYTEPSNVQNCYQRLQELGFNYGSSFQAVNKSWSEPGKNLSLIELPDDLVSSAASYTIHPIILDASGHIMNAAIANEIGHEDIYLPIEFKRLKLYRCPTETRFWSQVQLSEVAGSDRQVIKMDGYLLDCDGSVVMEIQGYSGKRTNRQALLRLLQKQLKEEIQERTYQIEWQKIASQPNDNFETKLNYDSQHWLIFSDRNIGVKLAKHLQQQGHICTLVYPGNSYQNSEPGIYYVNPSSPEDFVTLYQEVLATSDRPLTKVIHLWSIDAPPTEKLTISALEAAQKWGCGSVLHLVQALLKQTNLPQLWLVTQGAQPVLNPALAVAQTPLWGMGKVIALEHPQLWGGMVDLDPQAPEGMIEMLLMQMQDETGEDHLALRQNELYVARVVRQQLPESESLSFRSDSTYLIAGGLGALGLKVAEWMVEQGARYLVLTGRRGASAMSETAIECLQLMGAKLVVRKADVSQTEEMADILSEIQTSLPPLKGIIHAAGILEFESIERMTLAQLELTLRSKVTGAWVLHELTKAMDLDFFVGFSSIAAAWGSKGNAHYAAANHFLDGLAHYRQSIGLPMLSVNWGAWAEGGMVSKEAENLLVQMGVKSLDPKIGVNTLGYLMTAGLTQTIVADINWSLFKEVYQARGKRSLFQAIEEKRSQKQPAGQQTEIWQKLARSTSPTEIHNISIGYLQSEMARVLRVNTADIDVEQPVDSMGLDSLMALEMCNQIQTDLGVNVPIVKLMEGICLSSLATLISEQLLEMIPKQEVDLAATQDSNWMELVL